MTSTSRELLHRLAVTQSSERLPSVVAAVARDGATAWAAGRGAVNGTEPTADTQYRIGSISKTFVATLVMRMRDQGELRLDDTVGRYLPDVPVRDATIFHLLSHTSGLATETPPPWWERSAGDLRPELDNLFWADPFRHPAGRRWHYSNTGYGVLGAIIGAIRGAGWFAVLQQEVLRPLELTRTSYAPQPPYAPGWSVHPWADVLLPEPETDTGLMAPAGQLWSTATDLLRFAEVLHGRRDDVLRPDTVSEMQEPASGQAELNAGYGLGVMSLRDGAATMYGHNGSMPGYVAALWVDPDQGLSVTACANSTLAFPTVPMAIDIMRTVADREPKLPPTWQPAAVEPPLLDVTGIWYRGAIPFAVRIVDDCLEMARFGGPAGPVRFCARADGTWVAVTPGYTNGEILQILRDVNGTPTTLDLGSILFARQPYGELSG